MSWEYSLHVENRRLVIPHLIQTLLPDGILREKNFMNYAIWLWNKTPHPLLQVASCFRINIIAVSAAMARLFLEFLSPPFTGYSCTKKSDRRTAERHSFVLILVASQSETSNDTSRLIWIHQGNRLHINYWYRVVIGYIIPDIFDRFLVKEEEFLHVEDDFLFIANKPAVLF